MLTVKITFEDNANRGSFAIDAIAQTIGGDWNGKSSTDTSGIITNVDADNEEYIREVLDGDERVISYEIQE